MGKYSTTACLLIAFVAAVDGRTCHAQIDASEPALSVAFSDCNRLQAIGFVDGRVEVVNHKEKRLEHEIGLGRDQVVWAVEFSPTGRILAVGGGWPGVNGEIKIYSLSMPPAEPMATITTADEVRDLQFSPDGALLASVGEDKAVCLWDAKSGHPVARFIGHDDATTSVDFAGDGNTIISSGCDGTVKQWTVGRDEPIESIAVASRPVTCVRYSSAGASIYCCSVVQGVSEWTMKGKRKRSLLIPEGIGGCHTLAIDPAQQYIYGITSHGYFLVWDRPSGDLVGTTELTGLPRTFCISSDGRTLGFACRSIDDRLLSLDELRRALR